MLLHHCLFEQEAEFETFRTETRELGTEHGIDVVVAEALVIGQRIGPYIAQIVVLILAYVAVRLGTEPGFYI